MNFIREQLEEADFDNLQVEQVLLASEEALVNIIRHAYPRGEIGEVQVSCRFDGMLFHLEIRDSGKAFNPLEEGPTVDTHAGLEEREIGGLGVFFIRKLMDRSLYERQGKENVLTLCKKRL